MMIYRLKYGSGWVRRLELVTHRLVPCNVEGAGFLSVPEVRVLCRPDA